MNVTDNPAGSHGVLDSYLLILITEWPPDKHTRVLVGVMYNNVVAIPSDVHCTEEIRAMKQQGMRQACYCPSGHLEGCHRCSVVSPLHWNLHACYSTLRGPTLVSRHFADEFGTV